jgi:hypothetical protein
VKKRRRSPSKILTALKTTTITSPQWYTMVDVALRFLLKNSIPTDVRPNTTRPKNPLPRCETELL